jgi:serine/threonine protein kinase
VPAGFSPEAFGKYFLVDKIATGGMAEIFKAKSFSHAGFEKLLVIKRILQHHSENEDFVKMFIDEAKISVQLQHPNIVHIYDFGKLHSNCYIAMECVDGKDVKQILRKLAERRKYLPEEYAVFIAHDALAGLDHAHNKTTLHGDPLKIVHRDMSPSNVLVSYEGDVKVADFGIAKAEHRAYDTKDGVLKGKFEYMSPEQARGKAFHGTTDVFSTGIILWEMLTGRRMFKTDSDLATLEKVKAGGYPPPSVLNPHISTRLDAIVMKALAVEAKNRYPSALAFQNALAGYMAPNTPSAVKRSMSNFLSELFVEERDKEKHALDRGSKIAMELFNRPEDLALEPEWQEELNTAGPTLHQGGIAGSKRSSLVVPLLVVLIAFVGIAIFIQSSSVAPEPVVDPGSTRASVRFQVEPVDAIVYVNDVLIGAGPLIEAADLPVGKAQIRVESEGFGTQEFTMNLRQATEHDRSVTLALIEVKEEQGQVATGPKKTAQVQSKEDPQVVTPQEAPPPRVVAKGTLSVNVRGTWGQLEIDGKPMGTTPYYGELKPGSHTIRVYNEAGGFDMSRTVTIRSGELEKLSFAP